jgi:anhydro-N-acetylmuramic acid kinase
MLQQKTVIGIMSGTSLDGIDLACVRFSESNDKITYEFIAGKTIDYNNEWKKNLKNLNTSTAVTYAYANTALGWLMGAETKKFIIENNLQVDFIASHGHTIFHQPHNSLTAQIGDAAHIAALTNLPVVADFRTLDVALGGQGAPLVPIGDKYLFNDFDFCLNLGGIANISFDDLKGERIAFDICPANMILNQLANQLGMNYDKNGDIASGGKTSSALLNKLNALEFYNQPAPKSLGYEWFMEKFLPLVEAENISTEDKLYTACEHIAMQIAKVVNANAVKGNNAKMIVTGGGTHNAFLLQLLKQHCLSKIEIPVNYIINYKEAIIFALLGYLRWHNKVNTLASVTGAQKNSVGGAIYYGGS